MTMLERLSYRSFLVTSAMLSGVSKVFANNTTGFIGASDPCTDQAELDDQLPGCGDLDTDTQGIISIISRIISFILDLLGIIAVLFIIIAGIRLIVSQGEEEQREKAKKTILYVVIGLIVILFARIIVGFVTGTVPSFMLMNG